MEDAIDSEHPGVPHDSESLLWAVNTKLPLPIQASLIPDEGKAGIHSESWPIWKWIREF